MSTIVYALTAVESADKLNIPDFELIFFMNNTNGLGGLEYFIQSVVRMVTSLPTHLIVSRFHDLVDATYAAGESYG